MEDSYVCSKAKIKCSCGDKISTLTVFSDRTIWLTGEPQANISDHISMRNIAPFGKCHTTAYPATGSATAAAHGKLTPMPCVPNTPFPWMNGKNDVLLKGQPALLKSSLCRCVYGGMITITYDGQVDGNGKDVDKEISLTQKELDTNAENGLSAGNLLDGIQMALDVAGLVPGFGAIPDLLNACIYACRGDWTNAGFSLFAAIPGIGDAATAAKFAVKGAKLAKTTKLTQNAFSKTAKKFISKEVTEKELKEICRNPEEVVAFKKAVRKEREKVAKSFYERHGMNNPADVRSHVDCIDLDKPIRVTKVPPPGENKMEIYSYMQRGEDNSVKVGNYFTNSKNVKPSQLGITDTYGPNGSRVKEPFLFTAKGEGFDCLQSTAKTTKAPIDGNWNNKNPKNWVDTDGGATQMYIFYGNGSKKKNFLRTAKKL